MKVFVTGASGFVGQAVLTELRTIGHELRLLVRESASSRVQALAHAFQAEVWAGDLLGNPDLSRGLNGVEAVVHLVGIISENGRATYEDVHVRGTGLVVQAMQAAKVARLVYVSALGTRPNAVSRYHQTKWAAEEIVRQSGLHYTIFRPSIIYGPQDQFVNLLARLSRFSLALPVMGPGTAKLQPISVEAVARAVAKALQEPRAVGQTFDLCGTEVFSFVEVLDQILQVTGRRRWKLHLPLWWARALAMFFEHLFPAVLRHAPPLNRDQLAMLQEDSVGNPQPAHDLFGLPMTTFRDGIVRYLRTPKHMSKNA